MRSLQTCFIQGFRCKTRKTYDKVFQMLDFQMTSKDRELVKRMEQTLGTSPNIINPVDLDIVSTEVYQRYMWYQNFFPNGLVSHYSLKFNDIDPYL